jgi:hypothetical protein
MTAEMPGHRGNQPDFVSLQNIAKYRLVYLP